MCSAINVTDGTWSQAQLGPKFGGLVLRSLSHHAAAAAFIASLSFSGLGNVDNIHLQQAVAMFRSLPFSRRTCQELSKPNISTPYWSLPPMPTELTSCQWQLLLLPLGYWWSLPLVWACTWSQMAIRWWLGLDTSGWSMCPFCPDIALDPLGHHAVTCRHGGDVVIHHNRLRDEVYLTSVIVPTCVSVERGHGLTRDLAHTRPADILIAGWDRGKPVALDLTITSQLCSGILSESYHAVALAAEACKLHSNVSNAKSWAVLHSISCGDIWPLGQRGSQYLLQAGILPAWPFTSPPPNQELLHKLMAG